MLSGEPGGAAKKKKPAAPPIKIKNLPFDLPRFEAQPYTPVPVAPKPTKPAGKPAPTPAKPAPAFPFPPRGGGMLQPTRTTAVAGVETPDVPEPPDPGPVRMHYTLPIYAPNMSTPNGPVYSPPPAIARRPAPNMSTAAGAVYAPPPPTGIPQARAGARPYMPMIERAMPQPEAWALGSLPMSYPQAGTTDFFTGQAVQPNMSTPYGPVYVSPYSQLVNAGIAEPQPYTPAEQQAAQAPATPAQDKKAGRQRYGSSRGGSGRYYPSRYYGSGGYGGGGGGGGANAADYEKWGISQSWMEAYKAFWGQDMPTNMWGLYNQLVELFARYAGRMPQLSDWQSIWASIKADYTARGVDFPNPYSRLEMYEPIIEKFAPQPTVQLPTVSYGPGLSF